MLRSIMSLCVLSLIFIVDAVGGPVRLSGISTGPIVSSDSLEHRCCVQFDFPAQWRGQRVEYASLELQFVPPADSCKQYMVMLYPIPSNIRPHPGRATLSESYTDSLGMPVLVMASRGYKARVILTTLLQRWADGEIECAGFMITCCQPEADKVSLVQSQGGNPAQMDVRIGSQ